MTLGWSFFHSKVHNKNPLFQTIMTIPWSQKLTLLTWIEVPGKDHTLRTRCLDGSQGPEWTVERTASTPPRRLTTVTVHPCTGSETINGTTTTRRVPPPSLWGSTARRLYGPSSLPGLASLRKVLWDEPEEKIFRLSDPVFFIYP